MLEFPALLDEGGGIQTEYQTTRERNSGLEESEGVKGRSEGAAAIACWQSALGIQARKPPGRGVGRGSAS